MTVQQFWQKVVGRSGASNDNDGTGKTTHYLADLAQFVGLPRGSNVVVAVDVSLLLYTAIKGIDAAREFDTVPSIPCDSTLKYLRKCHALLIKNNITPVYVFDGQRNPTKSTTNANRENDRTTAYQKLRDLVKDRRLQDGKEVDRLRKKIAYPRPDVVGLAVEFYKNELNAIVCCAPYEAEWQCVKLEKDGIVHAVLSEDGDVIPTGASNIVSLVQWSSDIGKCCLYRRGDILSSEKGGSGEWNDYLWALSCLMGNDYMDRPYGTARSKQKMTFKTIKLMLESYIKAPNKDEWLENADKLFYKRNPADTNGGNVLHAGYGVKFQEVSFMIRHAPVFELTAVEGADLDLSDPMHSVHEVAMVLDLLGL